MNVYNTGAPPRAEVTASLCVPTGSGSATVVARLTTRVDVNGAWEFYGDWPPVAGGAAELLSQAQVAANMGLTGSYWRIVEPQAGSPNVWVVLVTGTPGAAVRVTSLSATSDLPVIGQLPGGSTPAAIDGGNATGD